MLIASGQLDAEGADELFKGKKAKQLQERAQSGKPSALSKNKSGASASRETGGDSKAMAMARRVIAPWSLEEKLRRVSIHMLFHHYDKDESRVLDAPELVGLMQEIIRSGSTTSAKEREQAAKDAKTMARFLVRAVIAHKTRAA